MSSHKERFSGFLLPEEEVAFQAGTKFDSMLGVNRDAMGEEKYFSLRVKFMAHKLNKFYEENLLNPREFRYVTEDFLTRYYSSPLPNKILPPRIADDLLGSDGYIFRANENKRRNPQKAYMAHNALLALRDLVCMNWVVDARAKEAFDNKIAGNILIIGALIGQRYLDMSGNVFHKEAKIEAEQTIESFFNRLEERPVIQDSLTDLFDKFDSERKRFGLVDF